MKPYHLTFLFLLCFALNVSAITKDTTYKHGDFLIEVSGKTHIDIVRQGARLKHKTSKGDTLFEAERYVVLGDDANITVLGLYKRFHLKQKFSNYPVRIYSGKLAKPDFKTNKDAYGFRTMIRNQCQESGVNFAGHYTLVEWGCGSDCQDIAIVDRINGEIYYSNRKQLLNDLSYGVKFRPDSRMMVANARLLERHKGYVSCSHEVNVGVVEWVNDKAKKLPE
jgi:hypothetical protein